MKLNEYYNIILDKYHIGDYKIKVSKNQESYPIINERELPLHTINYLIFEYLKDNKDKRWQVLFDFILVPNGVNQEGCDFDFTKIKFEDFFEFMLSIKN
jgi:hypothetical protein